MPTETAQKKWDDLIKVAADIGDFKPGDLRRWHFIALSLDPKGPGPALIQGIVIRILAEGEVLFSFANPETGEVVFSCMMPLDDLAGIVNRVGGDDPLVRP